MKQRLFVLAKVWSTAALLVIISAGCVIPDGNGTGTGGAGGAGEGGTLAGTDAEVCSAGCITLIGCGVELDQAGCYETCVSPANAPLVACFRQSTASCDPLSACTLATLCGQAPAGASSCAQGRSCLATCAGLVDSSCGCTCIANVTSADSAAIYSMAVCASVHCNFQCGSEGDPGSCESCLVNLCDTAEPLCL